MFGNLLNNSLIEELVDEKVIIFTPKFNKSSLQIAQYQLYPLLVRELVSKTKTKTLHDFSQDGNVYKLMPNAFVLIDILEQIQLPFGIVGRFIPSSTLIERGLGLTTGKIEYPFCHNGERIRFGLKNYLNVPIEIKANERIAYIEFFDLRGMDNFEYKLSTLDKKTYEKRKVEDADGPNYEIDNI